MSQKLKKFLADIDAHKPINLANLEKLIQDLQLHHYYQPNDIQAYRKNDKFMVEYIHPDLLAELTQLANQLGDRRNPTDCQSKNLPNQACHP